MHCIGLANTTVALLVISGCRMMQAIDALHTGRIFSLRMQSPIVRAGMDSDYARVMAVARVMGGLNSVELEVLIFSDATYAEPPTKVLLFSDATYVNQPRASRRRLQGVPLDQMDLSFHQILQFIGDLFRVRTSGEVFVGLSQTGLTSNMVIEIARAVSTLLPQLIGRNRLKLEMDKVRRGLAGCFDFCPFVSLT
jgi:hypothetical protein